MSDKPDTPRGMPIYLEEIDRKLIDSASIDDEKHEWYPSNSAASKLYCCVESMRDILEILEDAERAKSIEKKQRRLKIMMTPLHSLAKGVVDLLNDFESNPETRKRLKPGVSKSVSEIRRAFLSQVPIAHDGELTTLRNKLAAHVDKDIHAIEHRELMRKAEPKEVGKWLHLCLNVICDLMKLNAYAWSCESPELQVFRIMWTEPFLVTFRSDVDWRLVELLGAHIVKESPKMQVFRLAMEIVEKSQWMFGSKDFRITGFHEDADTDPWTSILTNLRQSNRWK